jgi:hypothetical protein
MGSDIRVEVVHGFDSDYQELGGDLSERFEQRADELMESIRTIAAAARARLATNDSDEAPLGAWETSSVEMSFGINLEAEGGVIIGKVKAGCAFTVTLTFQRPAP